MLTKAIVLLFVFAVLYNNPAFSQSSDEIAKEIIAITKAQWAAELMKKDISVSMQNIADEYTEFNPASPLRLDGKKLNMRLAEVLQTGSNEFVAAEMANEKVQLYGNVAILSYNFIGMIKDKDGNIKNNFAKSTRVYTKQEGKWMLVHANFAPVTSPSD